MREEVFTPFFRRFANENAREIAELRQLYAQVKASEEAFDEDATTVGRRVYSGYEFLPQQVSRRFSFAMHDLLQAEEYFQPLPDVAIERLSLQEFVEFRNLLLQKQYFYANQDRLLVLVHEALIHTLVDLAQELPGMDEETPFTIPLVFALPNPRGAVDHIFNIIMDEKYVPGGIYRTLANRLMANLCAVSGRKLNDEHSTRPWKRASGSSLPLPEIVETYLGGTPYAELFMAPVPLQLTREDRMGHMMVPAGPGSGKTSLIETLFLHDVQSDDEPSIIIIDPHSDMINRILQADLGLEDRIIYINPNDAPGLNPFALNRARHATYDARTKAQVMAGVLQTFNYLFSGLAGGSGDLTTKQSILFSFCAQLLLAFPETKNRNATLADLLDLLSCVKAKQMEDYQEAIATLPSVSRRFFEADFVSSTFTSTREELRYRVMGLLRDGAMEKLFGSPDTTIDIFSAMNEGKIILVDTDKAALKDGSADFGKLIISIVLQAVMERAAIVPDKRRDTLLIVDEASDFFSQNVDDLLTEARKFRLGCLFAFQHLSQVAPMLRASLIGTTGIKFASRLGTHDAKVMAQEMRTTPEFITGQPKLQFAAYIRDVTPTAVSILVEPLPLENQPQLSQQAFRRFIERNRRLVSIPALAAPTPPPSPSPSGPPRAQRPTPAVSPDLDDDISYS